MSRATAAMPYSRLPLSPQHPGLIVVVLDQSGSMADRLRSGASKAEAATHVVNELIAEVLQSSTVGNRVRDCCQLGVIGYGVKAEVLLGGWISQVGEPRRLVRAESPAAGYRPIWLSPTAEGGGGMGAGFQLADELVRGWIATNPHSCPPVVIHVTDGLPDDEAAFRAAADNLRQLRTSEGELLLFHVQIGDDAEKPIVLPETVTPNMDAAARLFFESSSIVPEAFRPKFRPVPFGRNARGLVGRASPGTIADALNIFAGLEAYRDSRRETESVFARRSGPIGSGDGGGRIGAAPPPPDREEINATMRPPPPKPRIVDENVQFTVFRPPALVVDTWHDLMCFAHLAEKRADAPASEPDPIAEVTRQAKQVLGEKLESYRRSTEDSSQALAREGTLTFVPVIDGVDVNPPQRTFTWTESVHREMFRIRTDASRVGQTLRGRVSVYYENLLIADVNLALRVVATAEPAATPTSSAREVARPYRKIFASYSHRDVAIVEQVERYARMMGDQYLRDWVHLRAGEAWNDGLKQMILEADVFQLFWSSNSMRSPNVRAEWEFALSLNRPHFVRPTYWEQPMPRSDEDGLPPPPLARLHFQRLNHAAPPPPVDRAMVAAPWLEPSRDLRPYASPVQTATPFPGAVPTRGESRSPMPVAAAPRRAPAAKKSIAGLGCFVLLLLIAVVAVVVWLVRRH